MQELCRVKGLGFRVHGLGYSGVLVYHGVMLQVCRDTLATGMVYRGVSLHTCRCYRYVEIASWSAHDATGM